MLLTTPIMVYCAFFTFNSYVSSDCPYLSLSSFDVDSLSVGFNCHMLFTQIVYVTSWILVLGDLTEFTLVWCWRSEKTMDFNYYLCRLGFHSPIVSHRTSDCGEVLKSLVFLLTWNQPACGHMTWRRLFIIVWILVPLIRYLSATPNLTIVAVSTGVVAM